MVKIKRPVAAAAMIINIAAAVIFSTPAIADQSSDRILAAELRIARDDLNRLVTREDLPVAHQEGLRDRIIGSLGLIPWLLKQVGDTVKLDADLTNRPLLVRQLDRLIARHPLDPALTSPENVTPKQRREARAIHQTYCAGCHDDAGRGDPQVPLPARDLFAMTREAAPDVFLARLINGVKGDETLLFTNPLTTDQLRALWMYYRDDR